MEQTILRENQGRRGGKDYRAEEVGKEEQCGMWICRHDTEAVLTAYVTLWARPSQDWIFQHPGREGRWPHVTPPLP